MPPASARRHLAVVRAPALADESDAGLARAAQEGHSGAPAAVWDRFSTIVRAVLRRSLGPSADVEDHVQDVFLRFFKEVGALRDPSALRSFLIGIAVRVARSELRRRRVRRWLFLTDDGSLPDAPGDALDDEAREAVARLYRVLDDLDDESRIAFVLRYIEALELTDVAAALDVSLATVKRKLARVTARVEAMAARDPILACYLEPVRQP